MKAVIPRYGKRLLGLAMVGTASAAYIRANDEEQDRETMAAMTGKMTTACVGRFLIDLPVDARGTMKMANLDGFDMSQYLETADHFARRLSEQEARLGAAPNMLGRENIALSKEIRGHDFSGKLFVYTRYRSYNSTPAGGKPRQSSLSEEMAVQVWERISSSVPLRPTVPSGEDETASSLAALDSPAPAPASAAAYPAARK